MGDRGGRNTFGREEGKKMKSSLLNGMRLDFQSPMIRESEIEETAKKIVAQQSGSTSWDGLLLKTKEN